MQPLMLSNKVYELFNVCGNGKWSLKSGVAKKKFAMIKLSGV